VQFIFTRKVLQACIVCVLSSAAGGAAPGEVAEAYTNHAGHAVCGRLTAITNGYAVIESRRYPLSIFPAAEQERMRSALGAPAELPAALVASRRSLRERWLRNEALLSSGAKSADDAEKTRRRLRAAWRRMLDDANLDPATRAFWLPRIP
jgi:hypothetical protein